MTAGAIWTALLSTPKWRVSPLRAQVLSPARQFETFRPPSSRIWTASALEGQSDVPTSVFALVRAAVPSGALQRLSPITSGTPLRNRTNWNVKIMDQPFRDSDKPPLDRFQNGPG